MKISCVQQPSQNNRCNFASRIPHPADVRYKKALQEGLKEAYGIKCTIEDLDPIAGPMELKEIIEGLKPEHYVPKENFRANFHLHTNDSDGCLTVDEYLYQCTSWANDVAKRTRHGDVLPPFSSAITDHNKIGNVRETVAAISQNPERFRNFKFVTGCEFMLDGYKDPNFVPDGKKVSHSAFEAVGLGFNPFDERLTPMTQGLSLNNKVSDVPNIIEAGGILSLAHPILFFDRLNEHFFAFLNKNGIHGAEGNFQYRYKKEYVDKYQPKVLSLIERFRMFSTGGTDSHKNTIF